MMLCLECLIPFSCSQILFIPQNHLESPQETYCDASHSYILGWYYVYTYIITTSHFKYFIKIFKYASMIFFC